MPTATARRSATDRFERIARTLAEHYPSPTRPKPVPVHEPLLPEQITGSGVVASYVGDQSADLALVVVDASALADAGGTELVQLADVLRPALEAAAATIGTGLLSEVVESDADPIFGDPDSEVYELKVRTATVAWLAVRLRAAAPAPVDPASIRDRLGRINDVEMSLTVEIGRTRMAVREVLSLTPGTVIELDRSVGAPADILLNGRLIAQGEIVVVDQDFAVRVTRILDGAEAAR